MKFESSSAHGTRPATEPVTYGSEVSAELWLFRSALMLGAVAIYLCFSFAPEWYWCALSIVVALAVGGAMGWRATVEPATGVVREEARLFGRKRIAERRHRPTDFDAIVFRCSGGESEEWWVGIRHRAGRKIWIKKCGVNDPALRRPGRYAEEFAWRLSCDTGLGIEEFRPQRPMRWVRSFFRRGETWLR
jgi:hypothetical protein